MKNSRLQQIIMIIAIATLPLQATDERYDKDEIKEDMGKAWGWISSKAKEGYESLKESYEEFITDEEGNRLSDKEIIEKLTTLAQEGSAKAQYYLGLAYLKAKDAYHDRDKAIEWLKKSAKQGYQEAIDLLKELESQSKPESENEKKGEGMKI
jgi:TPR repeat protein